MTQLNLYLRKKRNSVKKFQNNVFFKQTVLIDFSFEMIYSNKVAY